MNKLLYTTNIEYHSCECCSDRVVEYVLFDDTGVTLSYGYSGPVLSSTEEAMEYYAYLALEFGEFEMDPASIYF